VLGYIASKVTAHGMQLYRSRSMLTPSISSKMEQIKSMERKVEE